MNPNQGNFGYNQNIRPQIVPPAPPVITPPVPSSDELLKQFMKSQDEMNRLLVSQIADLTKSLKDQPSGSGKLPSNTIANPREDAKTITTRSDVSYNGPAIPTTSSSSIPKVVESEPEATKDKELPTNNGGTNDVHPQVVQKPKSNPEGLLI